MIGKFHGAGTGGSVLVYPLGVAAISREDIPRRSKLMETKAEAPLTIQTVGSFVPSLPRKRLFSAYVLFDVNPCEEKIWISRVLNG
jgi:hypothetical protein